MPMPASQDDDTCVLSSPSLSTASNDTRTKERVETSPTKEKGGAKTLATTLHTTQPHEMASRQEKSQDAVMNNEGDCPSSCPSNVTDRPSAPASSGGRRRRWKQEPPESTSAPPTGVEPVVYSQPNGQPEQEEQSAPPDTWRAARRAAHKPSAVKSKAANPYHLLQSITDRLSSIPEQEAPSTGSRVEPCGHAGLAGLAEVPASVSVKADPHMPDGYTHEGATVKQASPTAEVTLRDDNDQASECSPNKGRCKSCTDSRNSLCRHLRQVMQQNQLSQHPLQDQKLPCRSSHLWHPLEVYMPTCHQNGLWLESVYG